ncbi:MAG: hypothetical protein K2W95_06195 [Candidatus Obscuribacterales bacterium]|nr:hypothetical protein [Candidatus Obscuribacterales bacterium]
MTLSLRKARGSAATVELPFVLFFLFVVILFPIIDLSTICVRSYYLYQACHNACLVASKAKSFQLTSGTDISSRDVAPITVANIIAMHPGIAVSSVTTRIVITDLNTHAESSQTTKLTTPANTGLNAYQIRVTVTGSCDPLIRFNLPFLGNIPGLTAPMQYTMTDQNFVENAQGLSR